MLPSWRPAGPTVRSNNYHRGISALDLESPVITKLSLRELRVFFRSCCRFHKEVGFSGIFQPWVSLDWHLGAQTPLAESFASVSSDRSPLEQSGLSSTDLSSVSSFPHTEKDTESRSRFEVIEIWSSTAGKPSKRCAHMPISLEFLQSTSLCFYNL